MIDARVSRKVGLFIGLSVLTHLWLMYGMRFELPHFDDVPFTLEARLAPAPELPAVVPREPVTPPPHRAQPAQPASATAPPLPPVITSTAPNAPTLDTSAVDNDPPVALPVAAEKKIDAQPATAAVPPAPVVIARRLPRKGEIAYALYLGNDRFNVGRTLQRWEITGDRYKLASISETTGLAAVFSRQRMAYESVGKLTPAGLRPDHFTTERLRSGKTESAAADFNWNAAAATIDNPPRSVALPANAQDIVSFMYQLGLVPLTPGRIELPITNGWKLEKYELDIGVDEMLETPFGTLRAVPVRQLRRADRETVELWLAPAYRWLPVRIRFYNREGEPSGEQLVTDIRVSDD